MLVTVYSLLSQQLLVWMEPSVSEPAVMGRGGWKHLQLFICSVVAQFGDGSVGIVEPAC